MPECDLSDEQLLALYEGGSQDAFTELYRRYYKAMVNRLSQYTGRLRHIREEAVQRVFIKLSQRETSKIECFAAWIRTAVENQAIDILREEQKLLKVSTLSGFADSDENARDNDWLCDESQLPPDMIVEAEEISEMVKDVLPTLSPFDREIVREVFYNGLSEREAAALLDIPRHNVTNAMRRVRNRLGTALSDKKVA